MIGVLRRADNRPRLAYQACMTADWIASFLVIVLSPAIGSFLGLLADRLPRGEDVVARRSACRACGAVLGLRDLVPVLSFAITAGRCRHCGAAIPPWLLYAEIAAIGLAVIAAIIGGTAAGIWLSALFLWLLLSLTVTDLLWFRLPDLLTGALFVTALGLSLATGYPPITAALAGAAIGSGSFLALRLAYHAWRGREGLGLGDIKLMAGLGAATGPWLLPHMVLLAALAALAAALAGRYSEHGAFDRFRALPFGAALAVSCGVLWVLARVPG